MSVEFGRAVWLRFYPPAFPPCPNPSFVAHLGGVAVGLTLGVVVLQNYEQRLQEQSLFWIFFSVYTLFILCGIFWNIFTYNLLDVKLPPPPWSTVCLCLCVYVCNDRQYNLTVVKVMNEKPMLVPYCSTPAMFVLIIVPKPCQVLVPSKQLKQQI